MKKSIGEILLDLGYVTEDDIWKALDVQRAEGHKRKLGQVLRERFISEEQLLEALSIQFNLPLLDKSQLPDVLPIEKVSFEFMKQHLVLPLAFDGRVMEIAMADPTAMDAVDSLRVSFDCKIKIFLTTPRVVEDHIEVLHASKDAVMQRLLEGVSDEGASLDDSGEVDHLKDLAQEKGIIQLVSIIIENAIKEKSSDIHIEPEETFVRVRYRIDGILYEREALPLKTQAALSSRIKLLAHMNIAERRLPQDGRIRGRFSGKEVDIRVSTIPTVYGESIVMRVLDRETAFISLSELGFDDELLRMYEEIIKKPFGMILMTGPTGSGKTTSLYASLDIINSPDKKIITVEEPVEYLLKGINQIQVRPQIGLTFASGLRHIVRQDPDIIMVGEVRDLETASIAVHAALTGHLLFSTLHTNDAISAITRLADMGVEHYLVASTLIGVAAQRLVRRICPNCKEEYDVPEEARAELGMDVVSLWRGKGCDACMNTGYKGRLAIYELLVIDDDIRELIISKASIREIKAVAVEKGMRNLRQDGLLKAKQGITTVDEVFRVTQVGL
ncbi:type II secretion system ATPase GspE [Nitrospirota bacterium]